jgi:hypothetical protein
MNERSSRADILARVRAALQHDPASAEERQAIKHARRLLG